MSIAVERISQVIPASFVEEWYEFATDDHFWMQWRQLAFQRFAGELGLDFTASLRVMDVGAGNGSVMRALEATSRWTVDAVDLNLAGLEKITEGRGRKLYYDINERVPELMGQYDVVLAFDVIEHLPETAQFLGSAASHLKPGGLLLVNVPALQSMYSTYDVHVGHCRRYNRSSLRKEIQAAGLADLKSHYWGLSLVPVLAIRKAYLAFRGRNAQTTAQGFRPPHPIVNQFFLSLARLETKMILSPPLGSSLLMAAQRR